MKRRFPGLHQATLPAKVPDGLYLVSVHRAQYRWHQQKPFYAVQFSVVEPKPFAGGLISGRIYYCTEKALWKLSWFLRDFGYDAELLGRDELDKHALLKLEGVGKDNAHHRERHFPAEFCGICPAARWEELAGSGAAAGSEVA